MAEAMSPLPVLLLFIASAPVGAGQARLSAFRELGQSAGMDPRSAELWGEYARNLRDPYSYLVQTLEHVCRGRSRSDPGCFDSQLEIFAGSTDAAWRDLKRADQLVRLLNATNASLHRAVLKAVPERFWPQVSDPDLERIKAALPKKFGQWRGGNWIEEYVDQNFAIKLRQQALLRNQL